jgi:RES domain-containing protein
MALGALELLVHTPADLAPNDLIAVTIEIPDDLTIESVDTTSLPTNWHGYTDSAACRSLGDAWVAAGRTAVLRVPAAPVPQEDNYLISAAHAEAGRIRAVHQRPFQFDPRLLK